MSGLPAEDFGALADGLDISDITSDGVNANILRRLKNDDPELAELHVVSDGAARYDDNQYFIEDARGMGALGHYLGRSTHVTDLHIRAGGWSADMIPPFLAVLQSNRSIKSLWLMGSHLPRDFFRMLTPFIKGNPNLTKLIAQRCVVDAEQCRALTLALREGRSLKELRIEGFGGGGRHGHEQSIIKNIEALKMHPRLESLHFRDADMGRDACAAISDLLRQSVGVQELTLWNNFIDDSGVEALVDGLAHCRSLSKFYLPENRSITVRGWRALATVLEYPNSSLKALHLWGNGISDESATIFANALTRNNSLVLLNLHSRWEGTGEGANEAFSKVLCDTSSVNGTFLSNHTLRYLAPPSRGDDHLPGDIRSSLILNQDDDKRRVAVRKILMHHDDFDMQPLFEWDLKVLPFVIEWMERAATYYVGYEARMAKRKLSVLYQFIRGMPELAVEGTGGVNKKSAKVVGGKKRLHCSVYT